MAKELELKLSLGAKSKESVKSGLESLLASVGAKPTWQEKKLINHYFDTAEFSLNHKKIALRIRDTGQGYIQTLKTKGKSVNGISERGEWEWFVTEAVLNVAFLNELAEWPQEIDTSALEVVFETNFYRLQADIDYAGARIEMALDTGEVRSQGKSLPINELELELKAGDVSALVKLGELVQNVLGAIPSDISKAERGYQLFHSYSGFVLSGL